MVGSFANIIDVDWVEHTASSFLSVPAMIALPLIKPRVLETSIDGYLSIISGINHVGLPLSASSLANSSVVDDVEDNDDQSDSCSTDSNDTHDTDTEITPTRDIRPLTVVEMAANMDISCADCVYGSSPFLFCEWAGDLTPPSPGITPGSAGR